MIVHTTWNLNEILLYIYIYIYIYIYKYLKHETIPKRWVLLVWSFVWSFSGVDPVVNSHTQPYRHFTKKKKKKTIRGWKEETYKHWLRTAKRGKVKLTLLSILCMFMTIARTQRKSYTVTKDVVSSVIVFTARCLRTWFNTDHWLLWTHVLEPTYQLLVLGLNLWLSAPESNS